MEVLREGVHLRQMAQKDPLVEYTGEGERMFTELGRIIRSEVVLHLFHAEIAPEQAEQQLQQSQTTNGNIQYEHETSTGAAAIAAAGGGEAVAAGVPSSAGVTTQQPARASEHDKLGRNDPCWCGSGKKFKKCHGA
jgi:preprotein translocase subunit SecA